MRSESEVPFVLRAVVSMRGALDDCWLSQSDMPRSLFEQVASAAQDTQSNKKGGPGRALTSVPARAL